MTQIQPSAAANAPPLSFSTLPPSLPREIVYRILKYWMSPQQLVVVDTPTAGPVPSQLSVTYVCDTDTPAASLSPALQTEYWRLRHLSWLQSPKYFSHPYYFYMSHFLLSASKFPETIAPNSILQTYGIHPSAIVQPLLSRPHPHISTHGLEKIVLDFDACQYFAFFDVRVAPFDAEDMYADPHLRRAASLLEHCHDLTLVFGTAYRYAHPWYELIDPEWDDARCRPRVCEMGVVIDWILEYAWARRNLQHIERVRLEGDVQGWVRRKWVAIFEVQRGWIQETCPTENLFKVHKPDLDHIERWGMDEDKTDEWMAKEHYPPVCECEVGCWEIST
jgi:hypothetical protein